MKHFFSTILVLVAGGLFSQNNIRIFSANGELFLLSAFDSLQNKKPQTDVLLQTIYNDTVHIKLEFEDKTKSETTLFLFERGKPTTNKEFNYKVSKQTNKVKYSYTGFYAIDKLPNPLVPIKPIVDTTSKYKNTRLGHFCELKDGKPTYYNNIPKTGNCVSEMPADYLNYINLLMIKAQVVDDKYTIAENVCRNNCISTSQLNFILKYIDYELEKLKLIKLAFYNITDKNNKKDLEKSFRFESSILELNNYFKTTAETKMQSTINCETASSLEEIAKFVEALKVYANDSQRFEAFKKGYNEYCYSNDQLLSVLKTFIHDREKLDASKLLYYNCTEKDLFLSISDIFSYNETISELKDFVAKQKD